MAHTTPLHRPCVFAAVFDLTEASVIGALVGGIALMILGATGAFACEGDCDGNNQVTIDELITLVNIALGESSVSACPAGDLNGDGQITVDEVILTVGVSLNGCPPLPTPTPQAAQLQLRVVNKRASATQTPSMACFNGMLTSAGAGRLPSKYGCGPTPAPSCTRLCQTIPTNCPADGCAIDVGNVSPGVWLHQIFVPTPTSCSPSPCKPGQIQRTKSLLVVDPNAPHTVAWTLFRDVLTVNDESDVPPGGLCDPAECSTRTATCRLRCAINMAGPDTLIQFKETSTGILQEFSLSGSAVQMTTPGLVIDGTDQDGNPSGLDDFLARHFNKVRISENGAGSSDGQITFKNPNGQLIGLKISRNLVPDDQLLGKDQDVVRFGGGSKNSRITTCLLDGTANARTTAEGAEGADIPAKGKDCVDVGADGTATTSFADANVIENSELRSCYDRGIKSQSGYMVVRDSWVHNNLRGGLFAMVLNGHIKAERNIIENNGKNGTTASGSPTRKDAPQIAAQQLLLPPPTPGVAEVQTDGNIIRNGTSRGIFLDARSTATIANDYVCGMTSYTGLPGNGISTNANAGPITVSGTTSVYNAANGVSVNNNSSTNFGTGSTSGSNAFTRNGGTQFQNMTSPQTQISAANNQWQDCGNGAVCGSVSADYTGPVAVGTPQAHRNPGPFQIDGFSPSKVAAQGSLIRIQGKGFNAIEGHPAGGNCTTSPAQNNTCGSPPNMTPTGTCVEFEENPGSNVWTPAGVQSVTPTEIVVKWPFSHACSQPVGVRVRRRDTTATGYATSTGSPLVPNRKYCTN